MLIASAVRLRFLRNLLRLNNHVHNFNFAFHRWSLRLLLLTVCFTFAFDLVFILVFRDHFPCSSLTVMATVYGGNIWRRLFVDDCRGFAFSSRWTVSRNLIRVFSSSILLWCFFFLRMFMLFVIRVFVVVVVWIVVRVTENFPVFTGRIGAVLLLVLSWILAWLLLIVTWLRILLVLMISGIVWITGFVVLVVVFVFVVAVMVTMMVVSRDVLELRSICLGALLYLDVFWIGKTFPFALCTSTLLEMFSGRRTFLIFRMISPIKIFVC